MTHERKGMALFETIKLGCSCCAEHSSQHTCGWVFWEMEFSMTTLLQVGTPVKCWPFLVHILNPSGTAEPSQRRERVAAPQPDANSSQKPEPEKYRQTHRGVLPLRIVHPDSDSHRYQRFCMPPVILPSRVFGTDVSATMRIRW